MDVKSAILQTYDSTSRCIYGTLFAICAIVTIFGNLILIIIFCRPSMRSNSSRILTSLAVSDLLVGMACIYLCTYHLISDMFTDANSGMTIFIVMSICTNSSAITLATIAYDRFCKLFAGTYDVRISDLKTKRMIALAWILPILTQLCLLLDYLVTITLKVIVVFFAASIIAICYRRIGGKIKRDTLNLNNSTQDENTKILRLQKSKRLAQRLKILVSVYCACFIPIIVAVVFSAIAESVPNLDANALVLQHLKMIGLLVIAMDSAFNPIIHISTNPKMQKLAIKLLSCNSQNGIQ